MLTRRKGINYTTLEWRLPFGPYIDPHVLMAMHIFGVSISKVTPAMRTHAKACNYIRIYSG